jgi:dTDP-glucose 4,6-dehydratase
MKVVYITGCLGFIGSYVTKACLRKGWYVKGVDSATYAANTDLLHEFHKSPNFSFVKCDINDLEFLYDCDYVINTAAETHVGNSIVDSVDFVNSNICGVHNLLELLRNYRLEGKNVPTFLHFSTDEVYGDIEEGAHVESDLLKPSNPYSATKAAADMLILAWARTYKCSYVIVRPTNNYGKGQYVEKLVPKTCKYLGLGRKIPLHNDGTPVRNWLHAADTAKAITTIIERGVENEIYNIAGSFEQPNADAVYKIIKSYLGGKDFNLRDYIDASFSRVGQDLRYALDDEKLRGLGWKPERFFDDEIDGIVKYYKNNFIW